MTPKIYDLTSTMVKEAIKHGFTHVAGRGFACRGCGEHDTLRKFKKDGKTVFACKCGYRSS